MKYISLVKRLSSLVLRFSSGDIVGVFGLSSHQGFSGEPEVAGVVMSSLEIQTLSS